MSGLRDNLSPFRPGSMLILDEAHHVAPCSGTTWALESQITRSNCEWPPCSMTTGAPRRAAPGRAFCSSTSSSAYSIAAFHRTLTTHRKTLLKKRRESDPDEAEVEAELLEDNDLIEVATHAAKAELGDLDAAIAHVDRVLAISGGARDLPDARVGAMLDWIEAQMLDAAHVWRNRRLILFTEWDDTRRWLVERLKEGLLQRSRGRVDLNGRILVFTGQTSLEERDQIKIAFNAPFDREPVRILLCTDAAREGLNLQARCHDLIHVDLPWNPSRLEQRNGRIDRKLQPSKVVTCRYFFYDQREEDQCSTPSSARLR